MQELLQDHLAYFSLCLLSGEKVFIMFIITYLPTDQIIHLFNEPCENRKICMPYA